jgi:hypothetical protein
MYLQCTLLKTLLTIDPDSTLLDEMHVKSSIIVVPMSDPRIHI